MKRPYDIIDTRTVYRDRILALHVDRYTEHGSQERTYTRLELADWVNVVPLTAKQELVAIRQYRHGVGAWSVEVPAGGIAPGENPAQAARRELAEETGIEMETLISLGSFVCNAALQDNRVHTYLAYPVSPIPSFISSEGDTLLVPPAEWLSDSFLTANGNLFSTAALLLAKRYVDR